ncbi:MAG: DUF3122 domain-containing protein [Phormidesmis sp.]
MAINSQQMMQQRFCQSLLTGLMSLSQRAYWLLTHRFLWVGLLCGLFFSVPTAVQASSLSVASLHTYQELPGQTTFRSKQSLRDRSDRSWQVIVFKRYQADGLQGLYLRLVGFPGLVTLDTQRPLTVATGSSLQWTAAAELDPQTPALPDNAGQYNFAEPLDALKGDIPLQIDIPLSGGSIAELVVPPYAVHEWRELAASHT